MLDLWCALTPLARSENPALGASTTPWISGVFALTGPEQPFHALCMVLRFQGENPQPQRGLTSERTRWRALLRHESMVRALEDAATLLEDVDELAVDELAACGRVSAAFAFYGPWARARVPSPGELESAFKGAQLAIDDARRVCAASMGGVRFVELASVVLELCILNAYSLRPEPVSVRGNGPRP